jgi:hypothetical protein
MLEDDDFTHADIFITPPNDPNCSDEDSGDENEGTCNNLTRRQLDAEAVATIKRGDERFRIDSSDESCTETTLTMKTSVVETPSAGCSITDSTSTTSTTGDISVKNTAETLSASSSQRRVRKPSLRVRESHAYDLSPASAGSSSATRKPPAAAKRIVNSESDIPAAKRKKNDKSFKADKPDR